MGFIACPADPAAQERVEETLFTFVLPAGWATQEPPACGDQNDVDFSTLHGFDVVDQTGTVQVVVTRKVRALGPPRVSHYGNTLIAGHDFN